VSNPDFPGPSWQDSSPSADLEPYGRSPSGRPGGYGRSPDYSGRPDHDASDGAANGRRHRGADGAAGGGYQGHDARRGYTGEGNGRDQAGRGGNGYGRPGANGDGYGRPGANGNGYGRPGANGDGYGRPGANGDGDASGYGRSGSDRHAPPRGRGDGAGGARGRGGYASEDKYDNGRGDGASYSSGRGDHDTYGGNGRSGYGQGGGGYRGSYDPGADQYTVGMTDEELYRPTSPRGPGGPDGPDGPDDPDGPGDGRRGPGRDRGNWLQRQWHARWWRRWTIKKAALLLGAVAAGMVLVLIAGFFYLYSSVPLPLAQLETPPIQSSMVYFSNGKPIGCFCVQYRQALTESQLAQDPALEEAFLAAEDRNFWHEGGISVTGTARALLVDLSGGGSQGGSTITEQFVKSYLNPSGGGLTFKQKLKEIVIAIKLAKSESKTWILQHYLNVIDLGSGAYGVEAAARTYFGLDAWKLSPAQAAMLGAMVQQPYGFDPAHPAQNAPGLGYSLLDRWIYVLGNMARDTPGITQQQFNSLVPYPSPTTTQQTQADLKNFPKVTIRSPNLGTGWHYYLMNLVQNELGAYYHINHAQLTTQGYQVHTTIDEHLMNMLYTTVRSDKQLIDQQAAQQGMMRLPPWVHIGAVLEKPGTGDIKALYAGPGFGAKNCVACDYGTGTILSPQQVGSSFKPYVLTTAVSLGMNAKTSILDSHSPICIPPADDGYTDQRMLSTFGNANCDTSNGFYALNQPGENYKQSLTVPAATALSSNPAYEDLIHRTSVYAVLKMAKTLGVSESTDQSLEKLFGPGSPQAGSVQTALGQGQLTVVDQTNMIATLVSNGVTALPHLVSRVYDQNGQQRPVPPQYQPQKLLGPYVAADADYALSFDTTMQGATGHNAYIGRPTVAKTGTLGTLNHASQAWFVGAIPQYSMAVAMYTDRPARQVLDNLPGIGGWAGSYGGAWPATIWKSIMTKLTANLPVKQLPPTNFSAPNFIKWVQVKPMKQKKCQQTPPWFGGGPGGPGGGGNGGGGNGNGHHHHGLPGGAPGQKQCKKGGPSPSPSPSPSGSPTPSPSGSPSPTPSGSTSPSPTPPFGANPAPGFPPAPAPGQRPRSVAPSLTALAVLESQSAWRPLWAPVATGRR
jgi:membrane peptidoglycan carboxypeptidase